MRSTRPISAPSGAGDRLETIAVTATVAAVLSKIATVIASHSARSRTV